MEYGKYHAKRTVVNGISFDSKHEANRWIELTWMERAGEISDLKRQVKFVLIPAQRINGKLVEREVAYYADFVYTDKASNLTVVEDAKGVRTEVFKIKKKLMLWRYQIRVQEV